MKIVINSKADTETVDLRKVNMSRVYAFTVPSGQISVLHKLGYSYGGQYTKDWARAHYAFLNLSKPGSWPTHKGRRPADAIQKALNRGNTVMEFENLTELLKWKLKHTTDGD